MFHSNLFHKSRLLAVLLALSGVFPVAARAQELGNVDGTWEGTLSWIHGPVLLGRDYPEQHWRIVLEDNTARMFIARDSAFVEVYPGRWKVDRLDTNVIIYALASGKDNDGPWIASESFVLLKKGPDELGVVTSGAVNNVNEPSEHDTSKYFQVQTGLFRRVQ